MIPTCCGQPMTYEPRGTGPDPKAIHPPLWWCEECGKEEAYERHDPEPYDVWRDTLDEARTWAAMRGAG